MQKLYCYVDESGQDTRGALFVVALVITGEAREQVRTALQQIEERTGKHKKWKKTIPSSKKRKPPSPERDIGGKT